MLRLDCVGWRGLVGAGVVSVVLAGSAFSIAEAQEAMVSRSSVPRASAQWQASAPATRIHLDLRQRRISVIRDGQSLGRWPVAIGDPSTPTPTGLFQVESKLENPQYQSTKSGKVHPVTGPASPLAIDGSAFFSRVPISSASMEHPGRTG